MNAVLCGESRAPSRNNMLRGSSTRPAADMDMHKTRARTREHVYIYKRGQLITP